jgi:hypothetical protein
LSDRFSRISSTRQARWRRRRAHGVLEKVASTDFLQAIALLHTKKMRQDAVVAGVKENELPAVRATRQSLLDLPLEAYKANKDRVEQGFTTAAKFLRQHFIYRAVDLPYQTQIVSSRCDPRGDRRKVGRCGEQAQVSPLVLVRRDIRRTVRTLP